ncbi:MAG: endonuclease/exonuclease/phosphatase family protein [Pedobacter sp.]|jgi:endonuclease/exonuclease/phosphatase family metal-dependent hydrolase
MKKLSFILFLFLATSCGISRNQVSSTKQSSGSELKIMSYNIHIGIPPSKPGLIDMEAIIKTIRSENPDIISLQEVDVNTKRSGKINQAEIIARKLGMNFFFAKSIDHNGGDYGVCILSRFPISETKIHRLTTLAGTKGEPRVMATARIQIKNGKYIRFGATHLDHLKNPSNREVQIEEITKIGNEETLPFIIAGDLNAETESGVIQKLDQAFIRTCSNCEPTFPVVTPDRTIDFIAFKRTDPFSIISHRVVQEHYASDHLPVVALLRF